MIPKDFMWSFNFILWKNTNAPSDISFKYTDEKRGEKSSLWK